MFILPLKILFPVLSYSHIVMYLGFYSTKALLILLHSKFLKRLYGKAKHRQVTEFMRKICLASISQKIQS